MHENRANKPPSCMNATEDYLQNSLEPQKLTGLLSNLRDRLTSDAICMHVSEACVMVAGLDAASVRDCLIKCHHMRRYTDDVHGDAQRL